MAIAAIPLQPTAAWVADGGSRGSEDVGEFPRDFPAPLDVTSPPLVAALA